MWFVVDTDGALIVDEAVTETTDRTDTSDTTDTTDTTDATEDAATEASAGESVTEGGVHR